VIYSKYSSRAITLLALLPLMLSAQKAQESVVPLKNWTSPLYWHPNQTESATSPKPLGGIDLPSAPTPTFLTFVAMTPCRLVDTRGLAANFNGIQPFVGPSILAGAMVTFPVQSTLEAMANDAPAPCGVIPAIAQAYSFNLTVIPQGGLAVGYVTLWPAGVAQPYVATLNDSQGLTVDNAAIVPAGLASLVNPAGSVSLYNSGPAIIDVVIDMNGYFTSPTDLNGNTALGAGALAVDNGGTANTATGDDALQSTLGSNNTANGFQALQTNVGSANTAIGSGALTNNAGSQNTATGDQALQSNIQGSHNTANGFQALATNTGSENTAIGSGALANNAGNANTANGFGALHSNSGSGNTADGASALATNTSGSQNTASGSLALSSNTQGIGNTASGYQAMASNLGGNSNTATGVSALQLNTIGSFNTATGDQALLSNTASYNTADGVGALQTNTVGGFNTATGYNALTSNTGGVYNTAFGEAALGNNTGGAYNIAIGYSAGANQPPGNNDSIYIGSAGTPIDAPGSIQIGTQSGEASGTITIGAAQTGGTFIAGIYTGIPNFINLPVCVDSKGILGTVGCNIALNPPPCINVGCLPIGGVTRTPSSLRFKDQIADMGDSSDKLLQLRPVTFLYKPEYDDGSHALQYGLIAEEVAKLYPEMVGYDKDGQPSSVNYQSLAPMLLNELQKQAGQNRRQTEHIEQQAEQNGRQAEQIRSLEDRLSALEAGLTKGLAAPDPLR
jgi:hypothetical protein